MQAQQKALIVRAGPDTAQGLEDLNMHLSRGWRVVHLAPMGGAGAGTDARTPLLHFAALVVIEQEARRAPTALQAAEAEVEELVEELNEGDGAGTALEDRLERPSSRE